MFYYLLSLYKKIYSTLLILYYKMLYRKKYIKHKESIELNVSF